MRSRAPLLRVGPLVVDWRLTTRRLDAIGVDDTARANAGGIDVAERSTLASPPDPAGALLDELEELSTRGGERDAVSLGRFQHDVAALRALPGVAGPFRARVASASGWAALLFSSWRHLKYDRPSISGADRVRAFIRGNLLDARRMHRADVEPKVSAAHSPSTFAPSNRSGRELDRNDCEPLCAWHDGEANRDR